MAGAKLEDMLDRFKDRVWNDMCRQFDALQDQLQDELDDLQDELDVTIEQRDTLSQEVLRLENLIE